MLARAVRSWTVSRLFGAVLFVSVVPLGSQDYIALVFILFVFCLFSRLSSHIFLCLHYFVCSRVASLDMFFRIVTLFF